MRDDWQIVELGEVTAERKEAASLKSDSAYTLWSVPSFSDGQPESVRGNEIKSAKRRVENGDILLCKINPRINRVWVVENPYTHEQVSSTEWICLKPNSTKELSAHYLRYYLSSPSFREWIVSEISGATGSHTRAKPKKVMQQHVPLPPLPEQERIVSILDKAFEGIDKAIAQTEQNLASARELFESYLNNIFTQKGDDWVEKKLGDCIKLKSGDGLTAKNMNPEGCFNVYGGNGIAGLHDAYNTEGDHVIIGRVGALCGNARHLNEKFWLTDNAFRVSEYHEDFDLSFLTFLLNYKNLRSYARQAAQPVVSNTSLKEVVFSFPLDVETQRLIAENFDFLRRKKQQLEALYTQKLNDLKELKQSLLQQAFAGELTKEDAA